MALPCLLPPCTSITRLVLRWVRLLSSVSAKSIFLFVCVTSRNAVPRNWLSSVPSALNFNLQISVLRRFPSPPLSFSVTSFLAKLLSVPFKDYRLYIRGFSDTVHTPCLSNMQIHLFAHIRLFALLCMLFVCLGSLVLPIQK